MTGILFNQKTFADVERSRSLVAVTENFRVPQPQGYWQKAISYFDPHILMRNHVSPKCLVISGGAFRKSYLAGVLKSFSDHHYYEFKDIVAVSSGALVTLAYVSHQLHRLPEVINMMAGREYVNLGNLFRRVFWEHREIFPDFLGHYFERHYQNMPGAIDIGKIVDALFKVGIFKTKMITQGPINVWVGVTDVGTGEVEYHSTRGLSEESLKNLIKSSCKLPGIVTEKTSFEERPKVDGGVTEPIPLSKALHLGYATEDILVLMARDIGFRAKPFNVFDRLILGKDYDLKINSLINTQVHQMSENYNRIANQIMTLVFDRRLSLISAPPELEELAGTQKFMPAADNSRDVQIKYMHEGLPAGDEFLHEINWMDFNSRYHGFIKKTVHKMHFVKLSIG